MEAEYRKVEQDGVTLWVPSFMEFRNNEIVIVQRGFLWSAYLMAVSAVAVPEEFECGESCESVD